MRCTVFGTSLALVRLDASTTIVCCWMALGSFNDGAAGPLYRGSRDDRGFHRCVVSELQINDLRSRHLHGGHWEEGSGHRLNSDLFGVQLCRGHCVGNNY